MLAGQRNRRNRAKSQSHSSLPCYGHSLSFLLLHLGMHRGSKHLWVVLGICGNTAGVSLVGQVCLLPLVIGALCMLGSFWLGNHLNSHLHNAVLPRDQHFHSAFSSLDCDVCIRGQHWDVMLMLHFAKCSAGILQGLCVTLSLHK